MGEMAKIASTSLDELLDSLRHDSEKQAGSPGDGTEQRNRDGVPGGTDHVSGEPSVTTEDGLKPVETGERFTENSKDEASSYPNTPETIQPDSYQDKGNLSQEPLATTVEEKPADSDPKKTKDDSPTSHPASTEKDACEKIAAAIEALDAEIAKHYKEGEDGEKKENGGEKKENGGEKKEYGEDTNKDDTPESKEAADREALVKKAREQYPETFKAGQSVGEQFSEDFLTGATKAAEDLEALTTQGISETVKKASDDADLVVEYLAGIAYGQQKRAEDEEALLAENPDAAADVAAPVAPEETAGTDAEAAAAAEQLMADAAGAGAVEEPGLGPEDAGELSTAIDEALAGVEDTGGMAGEDEIIEAVADALVNADAEDEMAAAISEQEKAAMATAKDEKLRGAIKRSAIKKILTPRVKQALAKRTHAKKTRKR